MNKDIRLILADNLDELMKEKNLNQVGLSKRSEAHGHVSHNTISTYLKKTGQLTDPKLTKVGILASCLDIEPHELLDPNKGKYDLSRMEEDTLKYHLESAIELLSEAQIIDDKETNILFRFAEDLANVIKINIESEQNSKPFSQKKFTSKLLNLFNKNIK